MKGPKPDSRIIPFPPTETGQARELEELSDTELVVLGKACDEATHTEIIRVLFERHAAKIRALAYQLARDAGPISRDEFVDEVCHRFHVKLLEGLLRKRQATENANGTAYLLRVVRTTSVDYYREIEGRRSGLGALPVWTFDGFVARVFESEDGDTKTDPRWVPVPVENLTEAAQKAIIDERGADDSTNPSMMLDRRAEVATIKGILKDVHAALGGNHAEILARHDLHGWTFAEIAEYLQQHGPKGIANSQSEVQRDYRRAKPLVRAILERRGYGRRPVKAADDK